MNILGFLSTETSLGEILYIAIPTKVHFLWTAALGKISTIDILREEGSFLTYFCLLCYQSRESLSAPLPLFIGGMVGLSA